jgi:hypothetical protein
MFTSYSMAGRYHFFSRSKAFTINKSISSRSKNVADQKEPQYKFKQLVHAEDEATQTTTQGVKCISAI